FVEDALGEVRVAADEGVERVAQHAVRDLRHLRNVHQLLDGGVTEVARRGFGDVDGQIADAFQVRVDLHRRQDGAEVDRHRLVQREQLHAAAVDLDVELVDRRVPFEYLD